MKKNKGILKSKDLYKKKDKAQIAALVSMCVALGGVLTAMIGVGVHMDKVDNFEKGIVASPAYSQYVIHETEKYRQQLEEGKISEVQFSNYISNIDTGTFLDSEFVTAEQRAVKEYNDNMARNFAIIAGTFGCAGLLGALGGVVACDNYGKQASRKKWEEENEVWGWEN